MPPTMNLKAARKGLFIILPNSCKDCDSEEALPREGQAWDESRKGLRCSEASLEQRTWEVGRESRKPRPQRAPHLKPVERHEREAELLLVYEETWGWGGLVFLALIMIKRPTPSKFSPAEGISSPQGLGKRSHYGKCPRTPELQSHYQQHNSPGPPDPIHLPKTSALGATEVPTAELQTCPFAC